MSQGAVVAIHVAEKHGQPTRPIDRTQAVVGVGLSEDRYTKGTATLIEEEAVEAAKRDYKIELEASETRRNIVMKCMSGWDYFSIGLKNQSLADPTLTFMNVIRSRFPRLF